MSLEKRVEKLEACVHGKPEDLEAERKYGEELWAAVQEAKRRAGTPDRPEPDWVKAKQAQLVETLNSLNIGRR